MGKFLVSLLAGLLLCSQLALAQDDGDFAETDDLDYGVKFGANLNQFNQPGTVFGGNVGGFVRYNLNDLISFQGELIYTLLGGARADFARDLTDIPGPGLESSSSSSLDLPVWVIVNQNRQTYLHTVSVPLSAKFTPFGITAVTPYLLAGGSFDYFFAAIESRDQIFYFDNGNQVLLSDRTENVLGEMPDFQGSAHIGAGFDFYQEGGIYSIEFRYSRGFMNLNESVTAIADLTEDLYQSTISINFYYAFKF